MIRLHWSVKTLIITLICQNINNSDDNNRLLWILNNENSIILKALCQYKLRLCSNNIYIYIFFPSIIYKFRLIGWFAVGIGKQIFLWHRPLIPIANLPNKLSVYSAPSTSWNKSPFGTIPWWFLQMWHLYTFIIYYYFNEYIYYILKLNYKTLVYIYYL